MPKFFVSPESILDTAITICGEDAKHIKTVLRLTQGDEITVCDGQNTNYLCHIESCDQQAVHCIITGKTLSFAEPKTEITLYQGLPKADKMELIIQKCVELGIHRIVPVQTDRSIVKLEGKTEKKLLRWQKISETAAKQCGRGIIPSIGPVLSFADALQEACLLDSAVIPYELEKENGIREFVSSFHGKSLGIFIGPEGGFTPEEIKNSMERNVIPLTLGPRILRTETAGFTALAILLYELG